MEFGRQLSPCCKGGNDTGPRDGGRDTEAEPEDFPQIPVSGCPLGLCQEANSQEPDPQVGVCSHPFPHTNTPHWRSQEGVRRQES